MYEKSHKSQQILLKGLSKNKINSPIKRITSTTRGDTRTPFLTFISNNQSHTSMPTRNHILSRIKPKAKDFDNEIAAGLCLDYIKGPIARNNCQRPGGSSYRNTNCTCMQFLGLEQNLTTAKQVAEYNLQIIM